MKSYRVLVAATMMTVSAAPWIYAQEDDTPALKAAPLVSSSTVSPPARAATATSAATAIPARQMLNAQEAMRYEALSVRAKRSAQEETELRNLEKTGNDRVAEYLALSEKTTRTAAEDERLDTLRDTMLRNANQQVSREAAAYGLASGSQQPINSSRPNSSRPNSPDNSVLCVLSRPVKKQVYSYGALEIAFDARETRCRCHKPLT
jgi:hypothetical protein